MIYMTKPDIDAHMKELAERKEKAGHSITHWAKELKVSRSTITRKLQSAGIKIKKGRGAEYTEAQMRKIFQDRFEAIQDVRRWVSLAKIQEYHNYVNEREGSKRYLINLMEKGGTKAFWAIMLCCSESTIRRHIKRAGAYKERGAIYTGAEMKKICPDLFVKLDKKDAVNN